MLWYQKKNTGYIESVLHCLYFCNTLALFKVLLFQFVCTCAYVYVYVSSVVWGRHELCFVYFFFLILEQNHIAMLLSYTAWYVMQIFVWISVAQIYQLLLLQKYVMIIIITKHLDLDWKDYTLPLQRAVTRFIPGQVRTVGSWPWLAAHPSTLSLLHLNRTEGENRMKSTWVSFTPNTSPHLFITTSYTPPVQRRPQSLQCREGVAISSQQFLFAAPFF